MTGTRASADDVLPDAVLSAGLGVVLGVVVDSGLLDSGLVDAALLREETAELEAVLDLDGSAITPLIAPALASLAAPTSGAGPGIDPADLVTPAMVEAAHRLPAAQRARLAELAGAQYGLCSSGHRRAVRVVNSGRHARTQLICRICDPDAA
jgi:hypothetical protein